MSVDCEVASRGFCGVWKTQGCGVAAREFRGVGVRSLTSSLESTLSGSYGTRPAPAKPPWIFLSVMEAKKAARKPQRNSSLLTWLMCIRIKSSTWRPYACFSGPKQPTSSGWRRCEECGGMQRVIMLFCWQWSSNSVEWWLSWPSRINSRYLPFVRGAV